MSVGAVASLVAVGDGGCEAGWEGGVGAKVEAAVGAEDTPEVGVPLTVDVGRAVRGALVVEAVG
jgi:hypothetical protein